MPDQWFGYSNRGAAFVPLCRLTMPAQRSHAAGSACVYALHTRVCLVMAVCSSCPSTHHRYTDDAVHTEHTGSHKYLMAERDALGDDFDWVHICKRFRCICSLDTMHAMRRAGLRRPLLLTRSGQPVVGQNPASDRFTLIRCALQRARCATQLYCGKLLRLPNSNALTRDPDLSPSAPTP